MNPTAPFYLFVPRDAERAKEYEKGWSVPDIFNKNGDPAPGIVTTQDEFAISFTPEEAKTKVERLLATKTEAQARELFRLCSQDQWSYAAIKRELPSQDWRSQIVPILYRPFDTRFTVYNSHVAVHRRDRVNKHFVGRTNLGRTNLGRTNLALCTIKSRQTPDFQHVLVSELLIQHHMVSIKEVKFVFSLYLHSEGLFGSEKRPNFSDKYLATLASIVGQTPTPEAVFGYIYAVLHGPVYREKFAAFLKTDVPRVPLPSSRAQFEHFSVLGTELVALYTLDTKAAPALRVKRHELSKGSDAIEKPRYDAPTRRVWLNASQ